MTKIDIINKIQEATGFTKKISSEMLETTFFHLKTTLEAGESVKIAGFGKFDVKTKNDRIGRNPQTGESITISGRRILTFKASPLLKGAINQ